MTELPYRIVIGLEVHVQLLTRTKLFCGCSTQFGLPPNSATCPVCTGLPGSLPVMNRRAFELALRAATALNCEIASFTKWDRKNYFYPDLPKNYQISQYDLPFSREGFLEIETTTGPKRIRIIRVHLEEDAGKSLHDEAGGGADSRVDLNRTGTPLLEIVSHPDLATPEEAKAYLEEIRLLLRELEVSDCEMQEGSLRCDANVNIHIPIAPLAPTGGRGAGGEGEFAATPIIEVKNLNSFRAVERAMKYEADRQYAEYRDKIDKEWSLIRHEGQSVHRVGVQRAGRLVEVSKATAGWNDERGQTIVQRRKEEASDYRYFPDPDLVPVEVSDAWKEQVRSNLGELPAAQRTRLARQYGLSSYDVGVLTGQGRAFVAYFEECAALCGDAKEACNWTTNQVLQTLNEKKQSIKEFALGAAGLADLIKHKKNTGLNAQRAREVYARMIATGESAAAAGDALGFKVVADESQLVEIVRRAIAANAKAVADFKKGKTKAADAIKGAVMRETRGMAQVEVVQRILLAELEKA
jgi:aspartyl-tRNA(Asn)/glutamyl-tRNA(Gln) amidotransferase subunit B